MSTKRRKKGGRVTPKGGASPGWARRGFSNDERLELAAIFAQLLRSARGELPADADPLTAELFASHAWRAFQQPNLVGHDGLMVLGGGFIDHAAADGSAEARRVLRALAAVAPAPYGPRAAAAAARLDAVADPAWAGALDAGVVPDEAWMSYDPVDDDGVSVLVGFGGGSGNHTVGVYIDHNLGGIAKDAFVVPQSVPTVLAKLRGHDDRVELRPIDLAEAAARWRAAFDMTDMTWEPPLSEDLRNLRALIVARLGALPAGGSVPASAPITDEEQDRLIGDFVASDDAVELVSSGRVARDDVELLAAAIVDYGTNYVEGTPLRFSPVMVECFCCDWAPRKLGVDAETFEKLPDVLRAWIRFAGGRRGIPAAAISLAVRAVDKYADEMLDAAANPGRWGPAKSIVHALLSRGIDPTDERAVQNFIASVNAEGGIDALV
jgi:hypothetical protein